MSEMFLTISRSSCFPFSSRFSSSSMLRSKWSSMARLLRPVIMRMSSIPLTSASSTIYWIVGLSIMASISFGVALVAGKNRVPRPAAGITARVIVSKLFCILDFHISQFYIYIHFLINFQSFLL